MILPIHFNWPIIFYNNTRPNHCFLHFQGSYFPSVLLALGVIGNSASLCIILTRKTSKEIHVYISFIALLNIVSYPAFLMLFLLVRISIKSFVWRERETAWKYRFTLYSLRRRSLEKKQWHRLIWDQYLFCTLEKSGRCT